MQSHPNQDQILSGYLLTHYPVESLCTGIGSTSARWIQEGYGCRDTMHRTGLGSRVIGKTWLLQNQVKYGFQDITAQGEGGYGGTGDNQKKSAAKG